MPYNKRKQKCKQSDGTSGSHVLSYTDKKGKKHKACHTSQKKMQGQIAAIEAEADEAYGEEINEDIMRILVKDFVLDEAKAKKPINMNVVNKVLTILAQLPAYKDATFDGSVAGRAKVTNLGNRGPRTDIFDILKNSGFDVEHYKPEEPFRYIKVNGQEFQLVKGSNTNSTPEDRVLNNDAIGIFAEYACVQGLGGSSTIDTARNDGASGTSKKYASYDTRQRSLVDSMYQAFVELTQQARGNMPEPGAGVPGNVISKTAPVDVYLSSGEGLEGITADVHVKFNDADRLIGFQEVGKKVQMNAKALLKDLEESELEELPIGARFKKAREMFLKDNPEVVNQIRNAVKSAGGPMIDPTPEGVPNIKHLAGYSEPDYEVDDAGSVKLDPQGKKIQKRSKSGELKTKSVELRMLETDVEGQSNRKKFIDYLISKRIDQGFLDTVRKFFKEEGAPVYFFNYSSTPDKIATVVPSYSVSLKVTRMIGKPSMFSIEPRYDENTTYTFDILYDGKLAFQIETRTSGQGHPPQLKIHPTADATEFFDYKEEVFASSVQVETPEKSNVSETLVRDVVEDLLNEDYVDSENVKLIVEELTGADKSEIKRMIAKEIEGASNKRETKKIFQAEFSRELKKALGTSFIGEPGKINKFVKTAIQKEIEAMFKDKVTQNQIGEITKAVIKKLYRELSYSSVHIVDRIKL